MAAAQSRLQYMSVLNRQLGQGSRAKASAQTATLEVNNIHTVMPSVGRVSVPRQISGVPKAQDSAATCIHKMPTGRLTMAVIAWPTSNGAATSSRLAASSQRP